MAVAWLETRYKYNDAFYQYQMFLAVAWLETRYKYNQAQRAQLQTSAVAWLETRYKYNCIIGIVLYHLSCGLTRNTV